MAARTNLHYVLAIASVLAAVKTAGGETCVSTGRHCVRSCAGLKDGSYQSCHTCNAYVVCGNGQYKWACAQGLRWNDKSKNCDWNTETCKCLQSLPDDIDDSGDKNNSDEDSNGTRRRRRRRRRKRKRIKKPENTSNEYKTYYGFSRNCLKCICEVEGCKQHYNKCQMIGGSMSCGPFRIKKPYWVDAHTPGRSFEECTKMMRCSARCVRAYMDRYADACARRAGKDIATCEDYARVHNGGPNGCISPFTKAYWDKVYKCCQEEGGC